MRFAYAKGLFKCPSSFQVKRVLQYRQVSCLCSTSSQVQGQALKPTYGWIMENPRGMLRHQDMVKDLPRWTISYCQYGDTRMKPTDLWGTIQGWTPRPICKPRATCHESSPAGTNAGGTGKLRNARLRSMIPYELGQEICTVVDNHATTRI